jgi:ribonuclease HI
MGFDHVGLKEVISITSWYLWWMRRRRTHDEAVPPVFKCKMSILGIATNAAKATHPIADEVKWNKPETRQVKANVDATFHSDTFSGAVGVVARDYQGYVAAACKFLLHVVSASMVEALAMKEGLSRAIKLGCNSIVAEGDSLETINACSGEDTWWMESAAVYADCVDATTIIGSVIYQFCPREANKVADDIARFCFQNKITCTWDDDPPSFLLNSLVNDIIVL